VLVIIALLAVYYALGERGGGMTSPGTSDATSE
jgi:hypothetical protein